LAVERHDVALGRGRPERPGRCTAPAALLLGWIQGARFILKTLGEAPARVRLTWELVEPRWVTWRNDGAIARGLWPLVEK
jgi:hypothetical protein